MDQRLVEFAHLFNTKNFFDAHEVLESLWMETEGEDKNFYKGLIQCAVAFVHLQRNNLRGAVKLSKTAKGYLLQYPSIHGYVNISRFLAEFERCFTAIAKRAELTGEVEDVETAETPKLELQEKDS